ncbi:MAG: hypothetical protein V5A13_07940, partial [Haloarculaceae archaeon]
TATVRNDADRPGRTNLTVARDGTAVERRTLHLNAGGERAVSVRVQVPEGSHRITAGDRSVTVTGGDGETTAGGRGGTGGTGDDATTGGATPGFGVVGVAMAVALAVARTLTLDR